MPAKTPTTKTPTEQGPRAKTQTAGPLLALGTDGAVRFSHGPHKGKALSQIKKAELTVLLKRRYAHRSDPAFLLNEHLSRQYGRPMTASTAIDAMKEEWEVSKARFEELSRQPSLFQQLLGGMTAKLEEAASENENNKPSGHDADTWPK